MEGTGVVLFGAAVLAVWTGLRLWRCTSDLSRTKFTKQKWPEFDRQILWAQYWASLTDGQRASARISKITSIAAVAAVGAVGAGLKLLRILI